MEEIDDLRVFWVLAESPCERVSNQSKPCRGTKSCRKDRAKLARPFGSLKRSISFKWSPSLQVLTITFLGCGWVINSDKCLYLKNHFFFLGRPLNPAESGQMERAFWGFNGWYRILYSNRFVVVVVVFLFSPPGLLPLPPQENDRCLFIALLDNEWKWLMGKERVVALEKEMLLTAVERNTEKSRNNGLDINKTKRVTLTYLWKRSKIPRGTCSRLPASWKQKQCMMTDKWCLRLF